MPGTKFGGYTIEANALDIDDRPYVKAATEQWSHAGGVMGGEPTGHYLYVWAITWGRVVATDPRGGTIELAPGWYSWPDDDAPTQGSLL